MKIVSTKYWWLPVSFATVAVGTLAIGEDQKKLANTVRHFQCGGPTQLIIQDKDVSVSWVKQGDGSRLYEVVLPSGVTGPGDVPTTQQIISHWVSGDRPPAIWQQILVAANGTRMFTICVPQEWLTTPGDKDGNNITGFSNGH
jgi:hypothetical protein